MLRYIYIHVRSILPESLTLLREQLNMLLFKHLIGGKVQQNLKTINPTYVVEFCQFLYFFCTIEFLMH